MLLSLALIGAAAALFWLLVGDPLWGKHASEPTYPQMSRTFKIGWFACVAVVALLVGGVAGIGVFAATWPFWAAITVGVALAFGALDLRFKFLTWWGIVKNRNNFGESAASPPRRPDLDALLRQMQGRPAGQGIMSQIAERGGLTTSTGEAFGVRDGYYDLSPVESDDARHN